MKKTLLFFGLFMLVLPTKAQDFQDYKNKKKQEMERYKDSVKQDYFQYRQEANEEYARFMRQRWEEFQAMKGEPTPDMPGPPEPYKREDDIPIPGLPMKHGKVTPKPTPVEPLKLPEPPVIPNAPTMPKFGFTYYGTPLTVRLDNSLKFKLNDISENAVADAWSQLASEMSEVLLEDCLTLQDELALGDWAYHCLLRKLSEQYLGKNTNEAIVMETFMLAQSGYMVRIARKDNKLVLLMPFDGVVYEMAYLHIGGNRYVILDQEKGGSLYIFNHSFTDNERVFSLRMSKTPKLAMKASIPRTFTSRRYSDLSVTLTTNQNLMDFYNEYPQCEWTNYSWAGLSDEVKGKLYPMLRKGIAGRSQIEAANRIINFVQTAFDYKTDGDQFGYERSLFADESFFYPYNDCEDRSYLFSILMKDLLGLEVVLLHYPGHLATAVHYTEPVSGSYFTMDGKKWFISDPTYIGANVGECMPQYVNTSPEVYKL